VLGRGWPGRERTGDAIPERLLRRLSADLIEVADLIEADAALKSRDCPAAFGPPPVADNPPAFRGETVHRNPLPDVCAIWTALDLYCRANLIR